MDPSISSESHPRPCTTRSCTTSTSPNHHRRIKRQKTSPLANPSTSTSTSTFNPNSHSSPTPSSSSIYFNSSSLITHPTHPVPNGKGKARAIDDEQRRPPLSLHIIPSDLLSISPQHRRLIIQLDIDNFYVAVVRKIDPSLKNKPIGIKQKGILATISYEARKKGVDKLSTISNALRLCPDLKIVNGEDLTEFRRTSNQIFRLVRGLIWNFRNGLDNLDSHLSEKGDYHYGEMLDRLEVDQDKKVEKLGMDELWIDVTDMVDHHLFLQSSTSSSSISASTSNLSPSNAFDLHAPRTTRPSESPVWFPLAPPIPSNVEDANNGESFKNKAGDQTSKENETNKNANSTNGFWYLPNHFSGHLVPNLSSSQAQDQDENSIFTLTPNPHPYDIYLQRLSLASQFAQYLREIIFDRTEMTLSAGVSHNKLLSKLIGGFNKPDGLSCFVPFGGDQDDTRMKDGDQDEARFDDKEDNAEDEDEEKDGDSIETKTRNQLSRKLIDQMEVRKLNGFGSKIVSRLKEEMETKENLRKQRGGEETPTEDQRKTIETTFRLGNDFNVNDKKSKDSKPNLDWISTTSTLNPPSDSKKSLTLVSTIRQNFTLSEFITLFNKNLGPKLYSLLHAIDEDQVLSSPLFPNQIGIEDTFRSLKGKELFNQIKILSEGLLKRLEDELVIFENETLKPKSKESFKWLRYPLNIRLSIRIGWNNRISKQTKLSVELYEIEKLSFEKRSVKLIGIVTGLLKGLLKSNLSTEIVKQILKERGESDGNKSDEVEGLNLINLTATDLSKIRPSRGIGSFLNSNPSINNSHSLTSSSSSSSSSTATSSLQDSRKNLSSEPTSATSSKEFERSISRAFPDSKSHLKDEIDLSVLEELPEEIRNQILEQYGLSNHSSTTSSSSSSFISNSKLNPFIGSSASNLGISSNNSSSKVNELVCETCGKKMDLWLQHDHDLYPILGLPAESRDIEDQSFDEWRDENEDEEIFPARNF